MVREIGQAICASLDQLIDYHNVRVYRVYDDDVVPVAWLGHVGPYVLEDGDSLKLKVGEGITGWVAQHGVAQNLANAAQDERSATIPGTDDDLDESLLVAPMNYDNAVIGVIVLAKLGLKQFRPTTCACSRFTPRSQPRRWPTPTRPNGCARSPNGSLSRLPTSASSCA